MDDKTTIAALKHTPGTEFAKNLVSQTPLQNDSCDF